MQFWALRYNVKLLVICVDVVYSPFKTNGIFDFPHYRSPEMVFVKSKSLIQMILSSTFIYLKLFRWKIYQNLELLCTKEAKSDTSLRTNAVWKIFREFQSLFLFYYVFVYSLVFTTGMNKITKLKLCFFRCNTKIQPTIRHLKTWNLCWL